MVELAPTARGPQGQVASAGYGVNKATIAALQNGDFVVAYQSTNNYSIEFSLMDPLGQPLAGQPVLVAMPADGHSYGDPTATALADGRFLVTWSDTSYDGDGNLRTHLDGSIFNPDGSFSVLNLALTDPSSASGTQYKQAVAATADGGFDIEYQQSYAQDGVYLQHYGSNGEAIGSARLLYSGGQIPQTSVIARLTSGDLAIANLTYTPSIDTQVITDTGATPDTTVVQPDATSDDELMGIAALDTGGYVVTWRHFFPGDDTTPKDPYYTIQGVIFDNDGVRQHSFSYMTNVATQDANGRAVNDAIPAVTAISAGHFVVSFTSSGSILGQEFDSDGSTHGDAFTIAQRDPNSETYSRTALTDDSNGDFAALYQQFYTGSAYVHVFAEDVACYCRGTLIETAHGDIAIEHLRVGDLVLTADGSYEPIKWIGTRSYGGRFLAKNRNVLPVCIRAGALADNEPNRDLWISPHHAMYLNGLLVEAIDLVNETSIVQAWTLDQVDYFHIELDGHNVVRANGAWSESYIDDDNRAMFHNAADFIARYPCETSRDARFCAPRRDHGLDVDRIRRHIESRSAAMNFRSIA